MVIKNKCCSAIYNDSAIAGATSKTLSASKPGEYGAVLTLKSNAATICEAVINLAGAPCKIYELDLSCQIPNNITLLNAVATGVQLAVGDEFTAGDYTIVVTEIISGSPTGWKGKGYVKMKLVAGIVLKQISVNFENAVVNECYELASGSVVTDYDPNWGSVLDIDQIQNEIENIRNEIIEFIEIGKSVIDPQVQSLIERLKGIKNNDLNEWDNDTKNMVIGGIDAFIAGASCVAPPPNARVGSCGTEESLDYLKSIDLKGYEIVASVAAIKDDLPKHVNCSGIGPEYSICFGDKPKVEDTRFDWMGKSKYKQYKSASVDANYKIYKDFLDFFNCGFMAEHLKNGNGSMLDLSNDTEIIKNIKESEQLQEFVDNFQNVIKTRISTNKINEINNTLLQSVANTTSSPNFSLLDGLLPAKVFLAIGGTQYYNISLTVYRKKMVNKSLHL